jgi:hypothetical protein
MISEVQGMVMELRRVTLLWEELWLGTLGQHHADVQRRLTQLESEIRKVNTNSSLSRQDKATIIREKHRTILKPVRIFIRSFLKLDVFTLPHHSQTSEDLSRSLLRLYVFITPFSNQYLFRSSLKLDVFTLPHHSQTSEDLSRSFFKLDVFTLPHCSQTSEDLSRFVEALCVYHTILKPVSFSLFVEALCVLSHHSQTSIFFALCGSFMCLPHYSQTSEYRYSLFVEGFLMCFEILWFSDVSSLIEAEVLRDLVV